MDNQQLSQQVGAMWTTCNMLNVLKSEDQPPETVNRTKAFPKLSELALAKTALTFHIANEELQAIIHPESLYSSHKEPASFLLSFADSAICSPSEAELTQSDINDVIHNLAGMEVKSTEQIGGHQDQLFTHIEESGVSMENQYAKFSQDGFNEYIRFPAQQSSGEIITKLCLYKVIIITKYTANNLKHFKGLASLSSSFWCVKKKKKL